MPALAVLIVSCNHHSTIIQAVRKVLADLTELDARLYVLDNNSTDKTKELLVSESGFSLTLSPTNLGFCEGNNKLLNDALSDGAEGILFVNPDAAPIQGSIAKMCEALQWADIVTPKLIRGDNALNPLEPQIIDAAGMIFTSNFRHLDRGSGELDNGQYDVSGFVAGGTGAALLVSKEVAERISFSKTDGTMELFDERFFAYREDAELALRAQRYGFRTLYCAEAVFVHKRNVTPEKRGNLPASVNALSVKNRLLLLLSHWSWRFPPSIYLNTLVRNLLVIAGVLLREPSSARALIRELLRLSGHLSRRAEVSRRTVATEEYYNSLFSGRDFFKEKSNY